MCVFSYFELIVDQIAVTVNISHYPLGILWLLETFKVNPFCLLSSMTSYEIELVQTMHNLFEKVRGNEIIQTL